MKNAFWSSYVRVQAGSAAILLTALVSFPDQCGLLLAISTESRSQTSVDCF